MFKYKHYVPVLKGKRAEFGVLSGLPDQQRLTPLFEAIPSQPSSTVPKQMERCWPAALPYFLDCVFFDDEAATAALPSVLEAFQAAASRGQTAIPVTGTGRSANFQLAIQEQPTLAQTGVAIRLVPDDFEDEDELAASLETLLRLFGLSRDEADLIVDLGSVADQNASTLAQVSRANLALIPYLSEWRTLTLISGAFPMGLTPLTRNAWNYRPRTDWQLWSLLVTGTRRPARLPTYGDYGIANTILPPEGQATILAQLRYSTPSDFMIWKGRNAITQGFDQFIGICRDLVRRPEYRGADFSSGDAEIAEKAASGGSPGPPPSRTARFIPETSLGGSRAPTRRLRFSGASGSGLCRK
jgi:hypothetical protein